MPSRAPQSKLLLARLSSYHAPFAEHEQPFGVSTDSKLDELIVDLSRLCATLNLSEITNGGSQDIVSLAKQGHDVELQGR